MIDLKVLATTYFIHTKHETSWNKFKEICNSLKNVKSPSAFFEELENFDKTFVKG